MKSEASTPDEYVGSLPEDRREAIAAVRATILEHYPDTCDGQALAVAGLASQKNYMSLYLNCVYSDSGEKGWFEERWAETGKKLDMGKSCVRFRKLEDLPLDVVGEAIARVPPEDFIATYERVRGIS